MTRRAHLLLLGGAALAALGRPALAQTATIRQGYQTNIWGMPTYYLLQSGALQKQGIKFEEFAVPSGNLTMQQMVARQVDLGTYAGQSFILGADRGDLVGIAQIEEVGRTVRVMARKDLNISKVEDLRGKKIANQTGSSIATVFVDKIAPGAGLKKGDFQEIRMNVNDMVAALAAKTVDAMVNVEPYNSIAEADGIATTIMDYWDVDRMPVLMAATPDFVDKNPEVRRRLSQGLARCRARVQGQPRQGGRGHLRVLHGQGLQHVEGRLPSGARQGDGQSRLPVRPEILSAKRGGRADRGQAHQVGAGLEQGPASRIPGESARQGRLKAFTPSSC